MYYKNCRIFTADGHFHIGAFEVTETGLFGEVLPTHVPADAIDLQGATIIPGLIDVHIHGAAGNDTCDGTTAALEAMGQYLARNGITAFLPTTVSAPYDVLQTACTAAAAVAKHKPDGCARILGVHLEGPFFSRAKRGAHNLSHLRQPDFSAFMALQNSCNRLIRIADVAPELPQALDFIRQAAPTCTVSIAHTDANYEEAKAGFDAGATHLTHLFNGMNSIHHRAPGVIPAAAENPKVLAELICDGIHVHPAAIRLAFTMFPGRIIIISDALRCCGLPNGTYTTGDQTMRLEDGVARLEDSTICGSATNLYDGMRNAMAFGISEEEAVLSATRNPARSIGMADSLGVIAPGAMADFLICSPDYSQKRVFLSGKELR